MHPDLPPEFVNQITTGDARELARRIPDESIDLIFTDLIYDRDADYLLLAEIAKRVLKPDAALLTWSNGKWHKVNVDWLESGGLRYRWDFGCVMMTGGAPMNGFIIAKTNRLIWCDVNGQSKLHGYLVDGYPSRTIADLDSEWSWTKNPIFCRQAIEAFTDAGDVILDPFCGQATIPAVCKLSARNFIAFEIDPATAARARERVANTPVPLFTLPAEQAPLW